MLQRARILVSSIVRSHNNYHYQTSYTSLRLNNQLYHPTTIPMRFINTHTKNYGSTKTHQYKSFASKALIVTATATTYYCATVLFTSASAVDTYADGGQQQQHTFNVEKKIDDSYGIEYVGFDTYPGIHHDDDTGVATAEIKAASAKVILSALDNSGLNDIGIVKDKPMSGDGDDNTLHPKHAHRIGLGTCPVYGCPFLPLDVHYDETVKAQLKNMRSEDEPTKDNDKEWILNSSGSEVAAVLTLIGYKGGALENQINQDRALALSPYMYYNINGNNSNDDSKTTTTTTKPVARLIGAFDGHARFGEKVSEYVVKHLPALLGSKIVEYEAKLSGDDVDQQKRDDDISRILHEVFLELDATSPAEPSGGCTASLVLQLGTKIYIANAGDSRSFIAVHVKSPSDSEGTTKIVFGTREDKPHLSTERERVEHMGGQVYLPDGFALTGKGTTRVLYKDPNTGSTSGLAMSRSIGDWDAGAVGCIPDPLIDILDINEIKKKVLESLNAEVNEVEIDASGESVQSSEGQVYTEKDVKIFAVSATDGLLDYLPVHSIANHVATGLYAQKTPLLACEDLIYAAAQGWQEDKRGRYRDDIAISVTDLEIE